VRFTAAQFEAIRSGVNPGLTMVVGPPGTGKTDVAVQIIALLYHNNPTHKILLVTHSNAALNDLFEKIMALNIDPRHLLRLGSGERDLRESLALAGAGGTGRGQGEIFSKQGRVNWSLERRIELLGQVQKLGAALGAPGDVGYTCETAQYFHLDHIQSRLEKFEIDLAELKADSGTKKASISEIFPFKKYFSDTPKPLFSGDVAQDEESARGCFRHIQKIFDELADYRAFEVLRTQTHRADYLLTRQVCSSLRL
jgi:intron-binding protein aquarius